MEDLIMGLIRKNYLLNVLIPVIVALPGVAFADLGNCQGSYDNPTYIGDTTWDSSDTVPKTATIGAGTNIAADVSIRAY
jgi:hypothetical protein